MDIKPVKRRRGKPAGQPRRLPNSSQPKKQNNNNIVISSKLKPLQPVGKKLGSAKTKIFVAILIVLCALYLPASRFINTGEQYQDLIGQSSSIDVILNEATHMPQKLFLFVTESNGLSNAFLLSVYTFLFAVGTVYLFYLVCLRWLGRNPALLTTLLFASSSWMILSSQSLSFNNIYLVFMPLVIYLNYLLIQNRDVWKVFLAVFLFSITLYSPGMVWPILGFIALLPLFMQKILAKYNLEKIWILLILTGVMILPLLAVLVLYPSNFSHVLVGDSQISIYAFAQNFQASLEAMFISGIADSNLWLVGTPVFNYLTSLLFVIGLIALFVNKRLKHRFNFLAGSLVFAILTVTFVGLPALSLIVPAVYLTVGFGVKFLLDNWYAIFPSNPVARNVGLSLVIFTVVLSSAYDITRYYVTWPKTVDRVSSVSSEKIT